MDQGEENERRRRGGKKVFYSSMVHIIRWYITQMIMEKKDGERGRNRLLLIEKV